MEEDPINNFFTAKEVEDPKILYTTLAIPTTATSEEIRKAYRKLALKYHPDKHTTKNGIEKEELGKVFQRVGFAYAVLSDEAKRKRYDATGRTDDKFLDAEEMGWDAYFGTLFERLDGKMLNEHKAKYQGSKEEEQDLIKAYEQHAGSLPKIMEEIPHSQYTDEGRFIKSINSLIDSNTLKSTATWKKTSTDDKASKKRAEKAIKSAQEAESHAKELGIWDEMFGTGKKGKRKSDAKDEGEDGLAALILRRQKDREGGLDRLAEKYRKIEEEERAKKVKGKGKKGKGKGEKDEGGGPPEISDAEFEALQAKLFGKGKKEEKPAAGPSDISDAAFEKLQAEMFGKKGKTKA